MYVCLTPLISIFKLQNLSGCCMIHCTLHRWADRRLGCWGRSELTDRRAARRGLGSVYNSWEKSGSGSGGVSHLTTEKTEEREKKRPNEVIVWKWFLTRREDIFFCKMHRSAGIFLVFLFVKLHVVSSDEGEMESDSFWRSFPRNAIHFSKFYSQR